MERGGLRLTQSGESLVASVIRPWDESHKSHELPRTSTHVGDRWWRTVGHGCWCRTAEVRRHWRDNWWSRIHVVGRRDGCLCCRHGRRRRGRSHVGCDWWNHGRRLIHHMWRGNCRVCCRHGRRRRGGTHVGCDGWNHGQRLIHHRRRGNRRLRCRHWRRRSGGSHVGRDWCNHRGWWVHNRRRRNCRRRGSGHWSCIRHCLGGCCIRHCRSG